MSGPFTGSEHQETLMVLMQAIFTKHMARHEGFPPGIERAAYAEQLKAEAALWEAMKDDPAVAALRSAMAEIELHTAERH